MSETNHNAVATRVADWVRPQTLEGAIKLANLMGESGLVPKDFRGKPGDIIVAMQMGAELGLAPMQSLQGIAVINGRPSIFGDAALALARSHPDFEDIDEKVEQGADGKPIAKCLVKRRGQTPTLETFSQADAERANLWGKSGPWTQYPKRMLKYRARGFALRDAFADVLKGMKLAEEVRDYPEEKAAEFTVAGTTRTEQLVHQLKGQTTEPTGELGKALVDADQQPADPEAAARERKELLDDVEKLCERLANATETPLAKVHSDLETNGKSFLSLNAGELQVLVTDLEEKLMDLQEAR